MIKDASDLIVIDHHKSAMVELHDISNTKFDMTKSGAILSWEFFHPGKTDLLLDHFVLFSGAGRVE